MHSAAACVLAAVALAAGMTACGGSSADERAAEAAQRQAEASWRSGLTRWSGEMVGALNGISVLLSREHNVTLLQRGDGRTMARLVRFERTLAGCTAGVRRLGLPPAAFERARRDALRACASLESGSRLVRDGIAAWRAGGGPLLIDRATERLSAGQEGIVRARAGLKPSPQ